MKEDFQIQLYCSMNNQKDPQKLILVTLITLLYTEKKILQMGENSADGPILWDGLMMDKMMRIFCDFLLYTFKINNYLREIRY